jgi:hypothetical protein
VGDHVTEQVPEGSTHKYLEKLPRVLADHEIDPLGEEPSTEAEHWTVDPTGTEERSQFTTV